jgi:hypothetical protein
MGYNKFGTKFVRRDPRVPWFRSPKGSTNVSGYPNLAICARCKRLFNKWDAKQSPYEGILCLWCWNDVEPCKVCGVFYTYGSLDFTHICTDCRKTGRDLKWQDKRREIRVIDYHR